ncbi:glycosyl hydrolase family 28-related protein [Planctomicrobium sp. SH664]|uniref:glycosyl hydrolase family 28-related protein n=1 Tax=Planctomicrobium sp. SH664 TaxID=3448125 RepID=UPI003F5BE332
MQHSRRNFLERGSLVTAGVALGWGRSTNAALGTASGPSREQAAASLPAVNVQSWGAVGDGVADDTRAIQEAIQYAEQERIGVVALPAGTYLISDVLRLPSNLFLVGAGPGLSTLRAVPGTLFPLFKPHPGTHVKRQRRAMVTTKSVEKLRQEIVADSGLMNLTIDWNHCPTGSYGSSCVLMDSTDNCRLEQVHFLNCWPSDHPLVRQTHDFRCECVMFSNSWHGLMEGCSLVGSGYRPLSVSYGSQDILFQNGRITADVPFQTHAFAEVHNDKIPYKGKSSQPQLKLLNSTFVLKGGNAGDGICAHCGTLMIENCDFHLLGGKIGSGFVIKPFDGSKRFSCTNSRFYCEATDCSEATLTAIGSVGRQVGPLNQDLVVTGNLIETTIPETAVGRIGALISFCSNDSHVRIQGNHLRVRMEAPRNLSAIMLGNSGNFLVSNNIIEFVDGSTAPVGVGIDITDASTGIVTGNIVTGSFQAGLRLSGTLTGVIVSNNSFAKANGTAIEDVADPSGDRNCLIEANLI